MGVKDYYKNSVRGLCVFVLLLMGLKDDSGIMLRRKVSQS